MGNSSVHTRSYRDALPTHFTFKIQSFSLLRKSITSSMEKYESNAFEAGGYKWKLVFHPKGKNSTSTLTTSGNDHVSMYLKIVDTKSLPSGWTVDVSFRFFVLDQIRDKYLILGDIAGGTRRFHEMKTFTRRFHEMKTMWGYDKLLPLTTLNDSSNGYIVDDACVFGAEVFHCKNTGCGDCLTMVKSPLCVKYTWKIENFSKIKQEVMCSNVFNAGEHKWKIQLYPKGDSRGNNDKLSLLLLLNGSSTNALEPGSNHEQVYAKFTLRLRDQLHNFHRELEVKKWFGSPEQCWGLIKFMKLDELNDKSKGYLVNDTCIVEAQVTVLGTAKRLS